MKKNKLTFILFLIIILLSSYIIYDKFIKDDYVYRGNIEVDNIEIKEKIKLDYLDIYLYSDGISYIVPINKDKIKKLDKNNLKDRLTTLYEKGIYYDIRIDNHKLKGYRIKLDSKITSLRKIETDETVYIVFLKDNNRIGVFNYSDYHNLMYTDAIDNYNDYENVSEIKNNMIIYLDGSKEEFK